MTTLSDIAVESVDAITYCDREIIRIQTAVTQLSAKLEDIESVKESAAAVLRLIADGDPDVHDAAKDAKIWREELGIAVGSMSDYDYYILGIETAISIIEGERVANEEGETRGFEDALEQLKLAVSQK